jgi:sugar phosphate isomerase/epimerase
MNSRRTFIKQAGVAAAGAILMPSFACSTAAASSSRPIGLQLYTLREYLPKDVKGVLAKVAQAGYKEVETYGYTPADGYFGTNLSTFKTILKDNGLTAPSGHFGFDTFYKSGNTDDIKPLIASASELEMKYYTVPYLDPSLRNNIEDFKKLAERLNQTLVLCKEAGIKLAYHNHDFEFHKYGEQTGYEVLLTEGDKDIHYELDLYWVVRSGNDPIALFNKYPGRFVMWHVKDMDKANRSINTEVGSGSIDFKKIYKEAKLSGLEYLIVEQENFSMDPYKSIKQSFDYVNREVI